MPSRRLVAFAAAAVVVGLVVWLRSEASDPPPTVMPGLSSSTVAAPTVATGGVAPRREAGEPASLPDVPSAAVVVVRGRCLAAEDDRPLDATVRVGVDDGAPVDAARGLLHQALASATTDANGEFVGTVPIESATDLRVHAAAPARAPAGARRLAVAPGSTWNLGDIRLVTTAQVRGTVVDTAGASVADAEVGVLMLGHEPPALQFRESHTTVSDARGGFAFAAALAAGEWYVRVERTGALRTPRKLQVQGGVDLDVRIEVERPDPVHAIHGKVVDRAGAPLAGVELAAYGEGARGRAVSGADGTFVVQKGPPHFDRGEQGIELLASADGFEQVSPNKGQLAAWGQRSVVVVMRPLAGLLVRGLDARGSAVWPFAVTVGKLTNSGKTWIVRGIDRQRAGDDHIELPQLPSGRYALLLVPRDPNLATTGPVPFVIDEHTDRELIVRVPDRVDAVVEVVDGSGAPIPGCRVELVASLTGNPPDAAAPAPDLTGARSAPVPGLSQLAVASAVTDAGGRATLPAAPGPWLLRARCTTHQPAGQSITVAARTVHRLVLASAAVVRGSLVPRDLLPLLGLGQLQAERRLAVVALHGKEKIARVEVAADGTFTLGPLPPSVVALQLDTWLAANPKTNTSMPHGLGSVDGAAGALERTFDVSPFAPATVAGIVLWDGQPLRNGQFFLRRLGVEPNRFVRVPTDAEGRFRTLMMPGEVGVELAIPSEPGPGHIVLPLDERWPVAPGQEVARRIEAAPRRLQLRLRQAEGGAFANTRVQLVAGGYQYPGAFTTDADGGVEVAVAPFGAFTVTGKDAGGRELAGRCETTVVTGTVEILLAPVRK